MKQEDKQLLLKDLCSRLPYGVVINYNGLARPLFGIEPTQHFQITLDNALDGEHNGLVYVSLDVDGEEPKPYLRLMSSMTEVEKEEYHNLCYEEERECYEFGEWVTRVYFHDTIESIDWLNAHHFDYRGLILKGLALEAPEGMYKEEQQ